MTRKGQRSLTMVVTFIILLVVSGVVINLFLKTVGRPEEPAGAVEAEIESKCTLACKKIEKTKTVEASRTAIIDYCTKSFSYEIGGVESNLIKKGKLGYLSFCKDKARCFNFPSISCKVDGDTIDPGMCRDIMCKAYGERISQNRTEEEIAYQVKKGKCDLTCSSNDTCSADDGQEIRYNTWWQEYFQDPDCSQFFN